MSTEYQASEGECEAAKFESLLDANFEAALHFFQPYAEKQPELVAQDVTSFLVIRSGDGRTVFVFQFLEGVPIGALMIPNQALESIIGWLYKAYQMVNHG